VGYDALELSLKTLFIRSLESPLGSVKRRHPCKQMDFKGAGFPRRVCRWSGRLSSVMVEGC
jgi:hypothetical protein